MSLAGLFEHYKVGGRRAGGRSMCMHQNPLHIAAKLNAPGSTRHDDPFTALQGDDCVFEPTAHVGPFGKLCFERCDPLSVRNRSHKSGWKHVATSACDRRCCLRGSSETRGKKTCSKKHRVISQWYSRSRSVPKPDAVPFSVADELSPGAAAVVILSAGRGTEPGGINEIDGIVIDVCVQVEATRNVDRIFGNESFECGAVIPATIEVQARPIILPTCILLCIRT